MSSHGHYGGTVAGTICGTLVSIVGSIEYGDLVKTTVLAIFGAVVSFAVSVGLKYASKKLRKRTG